MSGVPALDSVVPRARSGRAHSAGPRRWRRWLARITVGLVGISLVVVTDVASSDRFAPTDAAEDGPLVVATIAVGSGPWGVAFSPDGGTAYVGDSWSDTVSVLDVGTRQVVATVPVPAGSAPADVAVTPDGSKVVVTAFSAAVAIGPGESDDFGILTLSVPSLSVATSGVRCVNPLPISMRDDGSAAYVGCGDGRIRSISTATSASSPAYGPESANSHVRDIAYVPRGSKASDDIAFIENIWANDWPRPNGGYLRFVSSAEVAPLPAYGMSLAVDRQGSRAYVGDASGVLSVFDIASRTLLHAIDVGGDLRGIALTADASIAYVVDQQNRMMKTVDLVTRSVTHTVPVGVDALRIALSPDERVALVTNNAVVGTVSFIALPARVTPPEETSAVVPLRVSCDPELVVVGAVVTCAVTGGAAGADILWRVASNPTVAEGDVRLGADGSGAFSFTVPTTASGVELTVELVDWTAPVSLGVVSGPIPSSVPAGGGQALDLSLALAALLGAIVLPALRRSGATRGASTVSVRRR